MGPKARTPHNSLVNTKPSPINMLMMRSSFWIVCTSSCGIGPSTLSAPACCDHAGGSLAGTPPTGSPMLPIECRAQSRGREPIPAR